MSRSAFDIFEFLGEYRRFPCLWKRKSPGFKKRAQRDAAELVLLSRCGFETVQQLRQKIRSIRCTYNQERAKVKKSLETGKNIHKPKLFWYEYADDFLRENEEDEGTESNPEAENSEEGNGSISDFLQVLHGSSPPSPTAASTPVNPSKKVQAGQPEEVESTQLEEVESRQLEDGESRLPEEGKSRQPKQSESTQPEKGESRRPKQITTNIFRKARKNKNMCRAEDPVRTKKRLDPSLNNAANKLKEVSERVDLTPTNEFVHFGNHIASQLGSLPLEEAIKLEAEIQSIITAARLRCIKTSITKDNHPSSFLENSTNGEVKNILMNFCFK